MQSSGETAPLARLTSSRRVYPITKLKTTIGSSPLVDIQLNDKFIMKVQCQLNLTKPATSAWWQAVLVVSSAESGGGLLPCDSTRPTYVNGRPVNGTRVLREGDEISFGYVKRYSFVFAFVKSTPKSLITGINRKVVISNPLTFTPSPLVRDHTAAIWKQASNMAGSSTPGRLTAASRAHPKALSRIRAMATPTTNATTPKRSVVVPANITPKFSPTVSRFFRSLSAQNSQIMDKIQQMFPSSLPSSHQEGENKLRSSPEVATPSSKISKLSASNPNNSTTFDLLETPEVIEQIVADYDSSIKMESVPAESAVEDQNEPVEVASLIESEENKVSTTSSSSVIEINDREGEVESRHEDEINAKVESSKLVFSLSKFDDNDTTTSSIDPIVLSLSSFEFTSLTDSSQISHSVNLHEEVINKTDCNVLSMSLDSFEHQTSIDEIEEFNNVKDNLMIESEGVETKPDDKNDSHTNIEVSKTESSLDCSADQNSLQEDIQQMSDDSMGNVKKSMKVEQSDNRDSSLIVVDHFIDGKELNVSTSNHPSMFSRSNSEDHSIDDKDLDISTNDHPSVIGGFDPAEHFVDDRHFDVSVSEDLSSGVFGSTSFNVDTLNTQSFFAPGFIATLESVADSGHASAVTPPIIVPSNSPIADYDGSAVTMLREMYRQHTPPADYNASNVNAVRELFRRHSPAGGGYSPEQLTAIRGLFQHHRQSGSAAEGVCLNETNYLDDLFKENEEGNKPNDETLIAGDDHELTIEKTSNPDKIELKNEPEIEHKTKKEKIAKEKKKVGRNRRALQQSASPPGLRYNLRHYEPREKLETPAVVTAPPPMSLRRSKRLQHTKSSASALNAKINKNNDDIGDSDDYSKAPKRTRAKQGQGKVLGERPPRTMMTRKEKKLLLEALGDSYTELEDEL